MSAELRRDAVRHASTYAATIGALVALLGLSPAHAGGIVTTDCLVGFGHGAGGVSCTRIWRHGLINPYVMSVPKPGSEEEIAETATRERLWQARCHPVIRQDMYGVRRYSYSAPGCEYGKYE